MKDWVRSSITEEPWNLSQRAPTTAAVVKPPASAAVGWTKSVEACAGWCISIEYSVRASVRKAA